MKKALITGIIGQDGSYLIEFLLSKGYEVHGVIRRVSTQFPFLFYKLMENTKKRTPFPKNKLSSQFLPSTYFMPNPKEKGKFVH